MVVKLIKHYPIDVHKSIKMMSMDAFNELSSYMSLRTGLPPCVAALFPTSAHRTTETEAALLLPRLEDMKPHSATEDRAAAILTSILLQLAAAHAAGVAHGDVQPRNVMSTAGSPGWTAPRGLVATLVDWGAACAASRQDLWVRRAMLYCRAPELLAAEARGTMFFEGCDPRAADVFMAGVTATSFLPKGWASENLGANMGACSWNTVGPREQARCQLRATREARAAHDRATPEAGSLAHLIKCMTALDPADRPSARRALEHPALQAHVRGFAYVRLSELGAACFKHRSSVSETSRRWLPCAMDRVELIDMMEKILNRCIREDDHVPTSAQGRHVKVLLARAIVMTQFALSRAAMPPGAERDGSLQARARLIGHAAVQCMLVSRGYEVVDTGSADVCAAVQLETRFLLEVGALRTPVHASDLLDAHNAYSPDAELDLSKRIIDAAGHAGRTGVNVCRVAAESDTWPPPPPLPPSVAADTLSRPADHDRRKGERPFSMQS